MDYAAKGITSLEKSNATNNLMTHFKTSLINISFNARGKTRLLMMVSGSNFAGHHQYRTRLDYYKGKIM